MSNGTSPGVEIKTEGYVTAIKPPPPPTIVAPSGVTITAEGYVVAPTPAEKREITRQIKAQYPQLKPGEIVTVSYFLPDQQTVTYFLGDEMPKVIKPPESVKLMGAELPEGKIKDFILGLRHALEVDEKKLTGELFGIENPELEQTAAQINKFFEVFAPKVKTKMLEEPVKFIGEAAFVTATFIPIIGTILTWKGNSDVGRAVNILIDIAILAPFARAGIRNIKMKVDPFKAASKQLILQEQMVNRQLAKVISKTYGKRVGDSLRAVDKAQAKYIEQLVRLDKLRSAKHPNVAKITAANSVAETLARDLEVTASKFVNSIKGKAGFDSPTVARMINDLPREMTRNIKSAVEGLKPQKVNVAKLKADVARAEVKLKEAQIKHPTDPSKWADLMADHAIAQSKLEQAAARGMIELYDDLLKARARLAQAKTPATRTKIQAEVYSLEDKVRRAIRSMEVEWGRGGLVTTGRGGVATLTRTSPKAPPGTGAGVRVRPRVKPTVDAISAASLARIRADYNLKPAEVTKIEPMVVTTLSPLEKTIAKSTPEVIAEVEEMTIKAIQQATDLVVQNKTMAEIRAAVENALRSQIQAVTKPALRTQLQTKLKIITRVAIKTAIKIRTRLKLKWRPKISIRIPTDDGSRLLTPTEAAGAVAWKQGFMYKLIYPPYGKDNIVNTTKPIEGVKYATGVRSAYESIVRIGGKVPLVIKRDMGIMDITITTRRKAKPRMKFKRDVKQRTRLTPATLHTIR